MAEATCRRELDLEIPATEVQKAIERVAREFARVARVPGFRPGKAPIPLIRRRFADDIKGEVLQSLVPEQIDKAVKDQKLIPITQPQIDHVEYGEDRPLKFRASFEVLPEFELGTYKGLQVEVEKAQVSDADIDKTLEAMRERAATFVPVEDRALESGDYAQLKLVGTPVGGGEPLKADNVLCHLGAEETLEAFTQNLVGAKPAEQRRFEVEYPADYPDRKLAGKKFVYSAEVVAVKQKKLPELNDELAKDVSDAKTLEELRGKIREDLERELEAHHASAVRSAGAKPNGYPPGAGGSKFGGPGSGSPSRECGLGGHAAASASSRCRGREGRVAARSHRLGGEYRSERRGHRSGNFQNRRAQWRIRPSRPRQLDKAGGAG